MVGSNAFMSAPVSLPETRMPVTPGGVSESASIMMWSPFDLARVCRVNRMRPGRHDLARVPAVPGCSATRCGRKLPVSTHHVNLTPQETSLIAESHPDALARMDEKLLKDLQTRLRQAREKNFSLLRRQGAARVEIEGARGAAAPANEKRGEKVEVFDEALARVAQRLDEVSADTDRA